MFAKVTLLCATLVTVSGRATYRTVESIHSGSSVSSSQQDTLGNYVFGYNIVDEQGASNSRSEVGDVHGNKKGYYYIRDRDGRYRRVDYVADAHGYRATISNNEPGTVHSSSDAAVVPSPYSPNYVSVTPVSNAHPAHFDVRDGQATRTYAGDVPATRLNFGDVHAPQFDNGVSQQTRYASGDTDATQFYTGNAYAVQSENGDAHSFRHDNGNVHSARFDTGNAHSDRFDTREKQTTQFGIGNIHALQSDTREEHFPRFDTTDAHVTRFDNENIHTTQFNTGDGHFPRLNTEDAHATQFGSGGVQATVFPAPVQRVNELQLSHSVPFDHDNSKVSLKEQALLHSVSQPELEAHTHSAAVNHATPPASIVVLIPSDQSALPRIKDFDYAKRIRGYFIPARVPEAVTYSGVKNVH